MYDVNMTKLVSIYDQTSNMKRALILGLLLFGMNAQANNNKNKEKQYEYLKKSKYFEIRAELEGGNITLEEAQLKWKKALDKLKKEEAK